MDTTDQSTSTFTLRKLVTDRDGTTAKEFFPKCVKIVNRKSEMQLEMKNEMQLEMKRKALVELLSDSVRVCASSQRTQKVWVNLSTVSKQTWTYRIASNESQSKSVFVVPQGQTWSAPHEGNIRNGDKVEAVVDQNQRTILISNLDLQTETEDTIRMIRNSLFVIVLREAPKLTWNQKLVAVLFSGASGEAKTETQNSNSAIPTTQKDPSDEAKAETLSLWEKCNQAEVSEFSDVVHWLSKVDAEMNSETTCDVHWRANLRADLRCALAFCIPTKIIIWVGIFIAFVMLLFFSVDDRGSSQKFPMHPDGFWAKGVLGFLKGAGLFFTYLGVRSSFATLASPFRGNNPERDIHFGSFIAIVVGVIAKALRFVVVVDGSKYVADFTAFYIVFEEGCIMGVTVIVSLIYGASNADFNPSSGHAANLYLLLLLLEHAAKTAAVIYAHYWYKMHQQYSEKGKFRFFLARWVDKMNGVALIAFSLLAHFLLNTAQANITAASPRIGNFAYRTACAKKVPEDEVAAIRTDIHIDNSMRGAAKAGKMTDSNRQLIAEDQDEDQMSGSPTDKNICLAAQIELSLYEGVVFPIVSSASQIIDNDIATVSAEEKCKRDAAVAYYRSKLSNLQE